MIAQKDCTHPKEKIYIQRDDDYGDAWTLCRDCGYELSESEENEREEVTKNDN